MTNLHGVDNFLADEPIMHADQDRLGRLPLADQLADQLLSYDNPSSLVIALNGPWGSGKSSMLNFVEHSLNDRGNSNNQQPIVLRFNPWNFSTIDQLITMFFKEVGTAINSSVKSKLSRTIGSALENLGSLLTLGEISPVGGGFLSGMGKISRYFGIRIGRMNQKTIEESKNELNGLLNKLGRRVFVLIDDIDRLDEFSMRLIFRLIRLNGDLVNTTYVLAFDRIIVDRVISREQDISGQDYLEKIVQVTFDIPPATPATIQSILSEELAKTLDLSAPLWDQGQDRWSRIYQGGLRLLIRTPRDIVRYINGLRFTYQPLTSDVNPIDFLGIEAVRLYAPQLYHLIRENRNIFVGSEGGTFVLNRSRGVDELRRQLLSMMDKCRADLIQPVRAILTQLFPEAPFEGESNLRGFHSDWRQEKRICTIEYFDRYFFLKLSEDEVSTAEFEIILSSAGDESYLVSQFTILIEAGKFERFLEQLIDNARDIRPSDIPVILRAMFNSGGQLSFERRDELVSLQNRLTYAAEMLLQHVNLADRVHIMEDMIRVSPSLPSLVFFVAGIEPRKSAAGTANTLPNEQVSQDEFEAIKQAILSRIREAAADNSLSTLPNLADILYRWLDWAGIEEPKPYVEKLVVSDAGLLDFLFGMRTLVISSAPPHRYYVMRPENISTFVDMDSVSRRVQSIKERKWETLSEKHKAAIEAFDNPQH